MNTVRSPFDQVRDIANRPSRQPKQRMPDTVDGGHGRVPAAKVDTTVTVPAPRVPSAKDAERLMQAELLMAARQLAQSTTELTARLGGRQGAVNGVLLVRLVALDVDGRWSYTGPVTIGSVVVYNHHETDPMYVASGDQGSMPGVSTGTQRVAAGGRLVMPVGAHAVTVWGAAAAQASVQVFTGLQPFGVSL